MTQNDASCDVIVQLPGGDQRRYLKHLSAACVNTHLAYTIVAFMHGLCLHLTSAAPQGEAALSASLKHSICPILWSALLATHEAGQQIASNGASSYAACCCWLDCEDCSWPAAGMSGAGCGHGTPLPLGSMCSGRM